MILKRSLAQLLPSLPAPCHESPRDRPCPSSGGTEGTEAAGLGEGPAQTRELGLRPSSQLQLHAPSFSLPCSGLHPSLSLPCPPLLLPPLDPRPPLSFSLFLSPGSPSPSSSSYSCSLVRLRVGV